jgi:hypothetical protein
MSAGRLLVLVSLACAACKGDGGVKDQDLPGLVVSPPAPPPVELDRAAADGLELGRAIALAHHELAGELGPHTVTITSSYQVQEGGEVKEELSDKTVIEYASDAAYHALYENSADYGREVIWQDGMMFLRPRYARWHRRPPTDEDEPSTLRDEIYGVAGAYFDLVDHAAEISDKGVTELAGRTGRRVEIQLDPSPARPPVEALTQRKWRETVIVEELSGDAVLDAETAAPLQVKFTARLQYNRDGQTRTMTVQVDQQIAGIGQTVAVVLPAPEEVVDTPERSREVDERDMLLDGMAPKKKKAGGASKAPK